MDDMMVALNPCLLVSGNATTQAAAHNRTQIYTMVVGQNATADMTQLCQLISDSPSMPGSTWENKTTKEGFSILLDVLWGEGHPTSVAQREYTLEYSHVCGQIEANYTTEEIPPLLKLIARADQLEFYHHCNISKNGVGQQAHQN